MVHRLLSAVGSLIVVLLCAGYLWIGDPLERLLEGGFHVLILPNMMPTLLPGDILIYDPEAYDLRDPARGEIALARVDPSLFDDGDAREIYGDLSDEELEGLLTEDEMVGRIVALPGDEVEIRAGRVLLNGREIEEVRTDEERPDGDGAAVIWETTFADRTHRVMRRPDSPPGDLERRLLLEDEYFLLGDHRSQPVDTRHFWPILREDLIGPVTRIFLSIDPGNDDVRWRRCLRAPR